MNTILTFDESASEDVLEAFGRSMDGKGYVTNPETGEREATENGEEVHKDRFAGLERGSIIFLDDDFNTLVDHAKRRRKE